MYSGGFAEHCAAARSHTFRIGSCFSFLVGTAGLVAVSSTGSFLLSRAFAVLALATAFLLFGTTRFVAISGANHLGAVGSLGVLGTGVTGKSASSGEQRSN